MSNSKSNRSLLTSASILAAAAAAVTATPAMAQDNQDEIVVTGTRIARPGFTSNSPIATVSAEEMARQQPVNVEEVLRDQPQFSSGNGAQVNNGSSGASTLDLRGLSTPRTLVLVDGKRMVAFDPTGLFDVSAVPLALLSRVDVVTGGASAVYGSDAIAGVVNFILNDHFQGLDVRGSHSWNDLHDTGDTDNLSVTMGAGFDDGRGNVALSLDWLDREAVYQVKGPAALAPGASSTTVPSAFDIAGFTRRQVDASGNLVPFYQGFDFNGQNLYQAPQKRWGATAVASYEITPNVEAYSRLIYSNSTSAPQIASSGTFGFSFEIPENNPFLTAQFVNTLAASSAPYAACSVAAAGNCYTVGVRWRGRDVGPRAYVYNYDTFQVLGGLRGELGDTGWNWDVAYAHGETRLARQQNNDIDSGRIQQAFFAQNTTTCYDPSNFCVPLNIFNPSLGSPDPAALDFIRLNLQVQSVTTQDYVTGAVTGDITQLQSPFASNPISMSFGAEYREETADYRPDAASQAGQSPGFGQTLPVSGAYNVMEFFTEALIPLVQDAPFARDMNLELGYRTSDYSSSGRVESYKYGLDWEPTDGLRFRGMFQRAVRAANINELFGPYTPGTGDLLVDPCAGVTFAGNPALYNLCVATGVPNPVLLSQPTSGQINNFSGGNPNLDPETADTVTVGFVYRPPQVDGLSLTVDYFDIKVNDAISVRPAFDILDACYNPARNSGGALDADCQLIARNALDGSLEGDTIYGVNQRTQNIGEVHVEGIDYGLEYTWDLGSWGSLEAALEGTHLMSTSYVPSPDAGEVDCLGFYGKTCGLPSTISASVGGPVNEDRFVQRTTWTMGDWELGYRWRYISEANIDALTEAGGTITGELDPDSVHIDAINYIDLSAVWQINDAVRLSAYVTNVTDEDAPFVFTTTGSTTFNSGNTYPSTYDVLGRVFSVGVQAKF